MLRSCLSLALVVLTACGSSAPPHATTATSPAATAPAPPPAPRPITALKRAEVKATIAHGLGYFLQNVAVEDYPVMQNGKFYGFKIKELNPEWVIDLRPGDVVTRVNGVVPEHPDEADTAFRALEKSTALKVDFERDGKPRTLDLPIVD